MSDGEHDSRSASADPPGAVTPTPGPPPRQSSAAAGSDALVPVHAAVFVLVAAVAVAIGVRGADAYHAARETGAFPSEVRRVLAFSLLFNFSVPVALVLAFAGEALRTAIGLVRGRRQGRLLARCGLALLPLLVFGLGHAWLNPWLPQLLRELRTLVSGS
jgi:hypothetical protein